MGMVIDRLSKAILEAMDIADGLDGTAAETYARAAVEELVVILNLTNNSSLNYTADELEEELRERT